MKSIDFPAASNGEPESGNSHMSARASGDTISLAMAAKLQCEICGGKMQEGIELHILPWYNLKNQAIPGQCPAPSMEQPDASHRKRNARENRLKKQ
jgi:hypothetical protein